MSEFIIKGQPGDFYFEKICHHGYVMARGKSHSKF